MCFLFANCFIWEQAFSFFMFMLKERIVQYGIYILVKHVSQLMALILFNTACIFQ